MHFYNMIIFFIKKLQHQKKKNIKKGTAAKSSYAKIFCPKIRKIVIHKNIFSFNVFPLESALWVFIVVYFAFLGNRSLLLLSVRE